MRRAFAAAALVEHDDAICCGIEEAAKPGGSAATRATVHDDNGFADGITALFIVQCVNVGYLEHASAVGVDVGVELDAFGRGLHRAAGGEWKP